MFLLKSYCLCFRDLNFVILFKFLRVKQLNDNLFSLIQVASSSLGFGPQLAMQLAERLYTQGFIRFPFYLQ